LALQYRVVVGDDREYAGSTRASTYKGGTRYANTSWARLKYSSRTQFLRLTLKKVSCRWVAEVLSQPQLAFSIDDRNFRSEEACVVYPYLNHIPLAPLRSDVHTY
jgi:hypothetical protein